MSQNGYFKLYLSYIDSLLKKVTLAELNEFERKFVLSVRDNFLRKEKTLSTRQTEVLEGILDKYGISA